MAVAYSGEAVEVYLNAGGMAVCASGYLLATV
jgi:hypothetical protein